MQMRPLAAQANVEEKSIAELKAHLKENLPLLDRERTCRELTRMQGELIKTQPFPHMTNGTAIAPLHALPRQVSSAACTGRQIALAPPSCRRQTPNPKFMVSSS